MKDFFCLFVTGLSNFAIFVNMKIIEIDSLDRPELDVYVRLTEAQLRNRLEPEKGIFIAESLKVIRIALEQGMHPISFLAEQKQIEGQVKSLFDSFNLDNQIPIFSGSRQTLAHLTGYELSRGFLCAMRRPVLPSLEEVCLGKRRIAIMDGVVNSTNTGAIFRASTALGIEGLLLSPTCCDPLNRRSVRVSMGTVFQIPWTYIGTNASWPVDAIQQIHNMGFDTIALALDNRAVDIDDPLLRANDKLAIVMGTEGDGLSQATISACRHVAKIPMHRGVDSLNVAAAAAVAFWQLR